MSDKKKRTCHSVATVDAPEFINLTPKNDFISKCEIKVLYLGENRNGSYIDKATATEMANTLPTCPIVGAFREDVQDFGDHGDVITIEDGEVKFKCKTRPYGFVAPDAKVWFQKFKDTDEFGNETEREYLMTEGYLWTGQYQEAMSVIEQGKSQSMELDPESMQGHWATNAKTGVEFFIINDAVFTKLCILGDDVEPCFEGASVTAPEVSKDFSAEHNFTYTLFTMMNELKEALVGEGGLNMPSEEMNEETEFEVVRRVDGDDEEVVDEPEDDDKDPEEPEPTEPEPESPEQGEGGENEGEGGNEGSEGDSSGESDGEDAAESFSISQEQYDAVVAENENLKSEIAELREFKLAVEDKEKDAVIAKYFMVNDDIRKELSENKRNYSLNDIEAKLAIAYVNENVDFSMDSDEDEKEEPGTVFSLDSEVEGIGVSGIVSALRAVAKSH